MTTKPSFNTSRSGFRRFRHFPKRELKNAGAKYTLSAKEQPPTPPSQISKLNQIFYCIYELKIVCTTPKYAPQKLIATMILNDNQNNFCFILRHGRISKSFYAIHVQLHSNKFLLERSLTPPSPQEYNNIEMTLMRAGVLGNSLRR